MITLCFNPQGRYLITWRGNRRSGAHFWITPASMARLQRVLAGTTTTQTAIIGGERWLVSWHPGGEGVQHG